MKRLLSAAVLCASMIGGQAFAATLLFDFGDSTQLTAVGSNYNDIIANPPATLAVANAVDSTGAPSGVGLSVSGFYPGSNTTGATSVSGAAAVFDTQATRDNIFGHTGPFGGNDNAPLGVVSLTGLNPSLTYNFTIFGSRSGVTDNRETQYDVMGANNASLLLNSSGNTTDVVVASGISPTATGTVTINVSAGPNNNNGSKFYYLGAMKVDYVPEPATIVLASAGIVIGAVRRFRGRA